MLNAEPIADVERDRLIVGDRPSWRGLRIQHRFGGLWRRRMILVHVSLLTLVHILLDEISPAAHIARGGADLLMVLGNARRGYWDRNSSRQRPHHRAFL